jgi:hypothetical protein
VIILRSFRTQDVVGMGYSKSPTLVPAIRGYSCNTVARALRIPLGMQ